MALAVVEEAERLGGEHIPPVLRQMFAGWWRWPAARADRCQYWPQRMTRAWHSWQARQLTPVACV